MVHKNLHHLIKLEMVDKNPCKIYAVLFNHFNGHKHRHIHNAKLILENFRFDSIPSADIHQFLELIRQLEVAQEAACTESYKENLIKIIVDRNPERISVMRAYIYATQTDMSFANILKHIESHADQQPANISMAAITAKSDQICFGHQTDQCNNSDCQYIHRILRPDEFKLHKYDPKKIPKSKSNNKDKNKVDNTKNKGNKNKNKKDYKNNNNDKTNGNHNPNNPNYRNNNMNTRPLTSEQLQLVGHGRGKSTPTNTQGYSSKQRIMYNTLIAINEMTHNTNNNSNNSQNNNQNGNHNGQNSENSGSNQSNNTNNNNDNYNNSAVNNNNGFGEWNTNSSTHRMSSVAIRMNSLQIKDNIPDENNPNIGDNDIFNDEEESYATTSPYKQGFYRSVHIGFNSQKTDFDEVFRDKVYYNLCDRDLDEDLPYKPIILTYKEFFDLMCEPYKEFKINIEAIYYKTR